MPRAKPRRFNPRAVIAVTDREGFVLAVWDMAGRFPNPSARFQFRQSHVLRQYGIFVGAITRAGTAAFLSSDQEAFTSRTAGFIIQQHFPPGVRNTPTGPLVGVGLSSLFFSDVNRMKFIPPTITDRRTFTSAAVSSGHAVSWRYPDQDDDVAGSRTPAVILGSLNDSPGGVPLYKLGHLVGGVGVTGDGSPTNLTPAAAIFLKETQSNATTGFKEGKDLDELVALAGQTGFRPDGSIHATNVLINGIRIPYVDPRIEDIEDMQRPEAAGDFRSAGPMGVTRFDPNRPPHRSRSHRQHPQPYPWKRETLRGLRRRSPFHAARRSVAE